MPHPQTKNSFMIISYNNVHKQSITSDYYSIDENDYFYQKLNCFLVFLYI